MPQPFTAAWREHLDAVTRALQEEMQRVAESRQPRTTIYVPAEDAQGILLGLERRGYLLPALAIEGPLRPHGLLDPGRQALAEAMQDTYVSRDSGAFMTQLDQMERALAARGARVVVDAPESGG